MACNDLGIDFALAAEEIVGALRELHARSGIDDVFGRLPDETEGRGPAAKS